LACQIWQQGRHSRAITISDAEPALHRGRTRMEPTAARRVIALGRTGLAAGAHRSSHAPGEPKTIATHLRVRLQNAIADRYTIEREIGHGGTAVVFLALDQKHSRHVALKVLRPEVAYSVGIDRFCREIERSARLNHPNVLPLYDSGSADGLLYFTS